MKKLFLAFYILALIMPVFIPVSATTTPTDYKLLEPLPFVGKTGSEEPEAVATSVSYVQGIMRLIIALAGALTVMKLVFAGFKYMTTEAFTGKTGAKDDISNALIGFLLVISSYILLNTINPKFLNFDLTIEGVNIADCNDCELTAPATEEEQRAGDIEDSSASAGVRGPSYGKPWGSDDYNRRMFAALKIGVNRQSGCLTIGEVNCTSLYNMSSKVIEGIKSIKTLCQVPDNQLIITGGTEYWLHGNRSTELDGPNRNITAHRPAGLAVDLSKTSSTVLNDCIKDKGIRADALTGCSNGMKYTYRGIVFVDENMAGNSAHWHVCFY